MRAHCAMDADGRARCRSGSASVAVSAGVNPCASSVSPRVPSTASPPKSSPKVATFMSGLSSVTAVRAALAKTDAAADNGTSPLVCACSPCVYMPCDAPNMLTHTVLRSLRLASVALLNFHVGVEIVSCPCVPPCAKLAGAGAVGRWRWVGVGGVDRSSRVREEGGRRWLVAARQGARHRCFSYLLVQKIRGLKCASSPLRHVVSVREQLRFCAARLRCLRVRAHAVLAHM